MKSTLLVFAFGLSVLLAATGCGESQPQHGPAATSAADLKVYQARYVLTDEPDGAMGVLTAREESKTDQKVVVVGRIGGSARAWVDGMAAFVMADASALGEDTDCCEEGCTVEGCTEPCCAQAKELKGFTALVKVVDEAGSPLAVDARQLLDVKERDTVVVRGRAVRDDAGNLTILADGIHVRR
jgi:hypothetical protein